MHTTELLILRRLQAYKWHIVLTHELLLNLRSVWLKSERARPSVYTWLTCQCLLLIFLCNTVEARTDCQCTQAHQICFFHLLGLFLNKDTSQSLLPKYISLISISKHLNICSLHCIFLPVFFFKSLQPPEYKNGPLLSFNLCRAGMMKLDIPLPEQEFPWLSSFVLCDASYLYIPQWVSPVALSMSWCYLSLFPTEAHPFSNPTAILYAKDKYYLPCETSVLSPQRECTELISNGCLHTVIGFLRQDV